MNEKEAREYFQRFLEVECVECLARPGELCVSNAVWVHMQRFNAIYLRDAIRADDSRPMHD